MKKRIPLIFLSLLISSSVLAQPKHYSVVCIKNNTTEYMKLQWGWRGDSRHSTHVPPGKVFMRTWIHNASDESRSPDFLVDVYPLKGGALDHYTLLASKTPKKQCKHADRVFINGNKSSEILIEGRSVRKGRNRNNLGI